MEAKDLFITAAQGNEQSLNVLFERYRPQVYAIALKICGHTPAAEDAVQEAFIIAYTHLHQLKNPNAFLPWIKRITANCCFQMLRKDKRLTIMEELPKNPQLIDDCINRRFEKMALRDSLYVALSSLPIALRHTLLLRYLSDYNSYSQIAEITGVPVGTVRSRLSEGKKQLKLYWKSKQDTDHTEFSNVNYWNTFYTELLPGIYTDAGNLPVLLRHLFTDMKLVFTSGKMAVGRDIFENSIYDDFDHGSSLSAVNSCITSGNLTVMNVSFANTAEHPYHCPPGSFLTFYREKGKMVKMGLFHAQRETTLVTSEYA